MSDRPRPLRVALAILGAVNAVAVATVPVLQGVGLINLNAETLGLIVTLIGVTVGSVSSVFAAFYMEGQVTPVNDPKAVDLVPLVPVAGDGLDD